MSESTNDAIYSVSTSLHGLFLISPVEITHVTINQHETSKGLLLCKSYESVKRALYLVWLLSEGKVYESNSMCTDSPMYGTTTGSTATKL